MHVSKIAFLALVLVSSCGKPAEQARRPLTDAEAKPLLNTYGCNSCHAIDEFRIGPSYRDIAFRYADAGDQLEDRLVLKVVHGGAGAWGQTPMVSNPRLPDEEARQLVRWILSLDQNDPTTPDEQQ